MEDPTIYDYDDVHDEIQVRRKVVEESKKTKDRNARYIGHIVNATEKRKREQSLIYEKIAEKELQREGKEFIDKEKFVTSSYLKMMEENKKWELDDLKKEEYNKAHTATADNNAAGLYRTLYKQDIFSGGHRPDLSKAPELPPIQQNTQPPQTKLDEKTLEIKQIKENEHEPMEQIPLARKPLKEKEMEEIIPPKVESEKKISSPVKILQKQVSRSRSRSGEKEQKESKTTEKTEFVRDTEKPAPEKELTKEEKLKLYKERYLQRKVADT